MKCYSGIRKNEDRERTMPLVVRGSQVTLSVQFQLTFSGGRGTEGRGVVGTEAKISGKCEDKHSLWGGG